MTQHHDDTPSTTTQTAHGTGTATPSSPFVRELAAQVADLRERSHDWGDTRTDAALDTLTSEFAARLVEQPDEVEHLLDALRDEPEGTTLHGVLRALAVPWPPLALADAPRFRAHPAVRSTEAAMPVAPAAALPPLDALTGMDERLMAQEELSWLAGRPLSLGLTEWPRTSEGTPLTHLFSAHLTTLSPWREIGLMSPGILQVFHDRTSSGARGDSAASSADQGWLVRYVRDVDLPSNLAVTPVLDWPKDVEAAQRVAAIPTSPHLVATVPSAETLGDAPADERARHARVVDLLEWWTRVMNSINAPEREHGEDPYVDAERPALQSTTRLGGFPQTPLTEAQSTARAEALPLGPDDSYVLLADVNPTEVTEHDWLSGRHLQVWMRGMDLALGRFEKAWCLLTDS